MDLVHTPSIPVHLYLQEAHLDSNNNNMDKRSDQAYHDDGGSILLFHVL